MLGQCPTVPPIANRSCVFASSVANMINIPGTLEFRKIYAIETAPAVAIEVDGATDDGLNTHPRHNAAGQTLALIDGSDGANAYEACAKFSHGGVTKYYTGGVDTVKNNANDVLTVFVKMSWCDWNAAAQRFVPDPAGTVFTY